MAKFGGFPGGMGGMNMNMYVVMQPANVSKISPSKSGLSVCLLINTHLVPAGIFRVIKRFVRS